MLDEVIFFNSFIVNNDVSDDVKYPWRQRFFIVIAVR